MVAVTYRHGLEKSATAKSKTFFAGVVSVLGRALHALQESRMRQAEREIALHRHLLPGDVLTARNEHQLPFKR